MFLFNLHVSHSFASSPPSDTLQVFTSLREAMKTPGKVFILHLKGQKLRKVPNEVFLLTNLVELDLSHNRIEIIPDSIHQLRNLKVLKLGSNRLHTLSDSIGSLARISDIDLSRNRLVNLPASIGKLTNLDTLLLWKNEIGHLPVEISGLKENIVVLDLRHNPFPPEEAEKLRSWLPNTSINLTRSCACTGG